MKIFKILTIMAVIGMTLGCATTPCDKIKNECVANDGLAVVVFDDNGEAEYLFCKRLENNDILCDIRK